MEVDFPAAHSMDSQWFAVDRDGRIGLFETGESGAMPLPLSPDEPGVNLSPALLQGLPSSEPIHVRGGHFLPATGEGMHRAPPGGPVEHVLFFLDSLKPVQAEIKAGRAFPVQASEGEAVIMPQVPAGVFARLHKSGACRGCLHWWRPMDTDPGIPEPGFYFYYHLDGPCANPYGQFTRPSRPLHIDQLPADVRESLRTVTLNVSFEEAVLVQPIEHRECSVWAGAAYLESSGKVIRPIPGNEEEYAQEYEALMHDFGDRFEIEPPAKKPRKPKRRKKK